MYGTYSTRGCPGINIVLNFTLCCIITYLLTHPFVLHFPSILVTASVLSNVCTYICTYTINNEVCIPDIMVCYMAVWDANHSDYIVIRTQQCNLSQRILYSVTWEIGKLASSLWHSLSENMSRYSDKHCKPAWVCLTDKQ